MVHKFNSSADRITLFSRTHGMLFSINQMASFLVGSCQLQLCAVNVPRFEPWAEYVVEDCEESLPVLASFRPTCAHC